MGGRVRGRALAALAAVTLVAGLGLAAPASAAPGGGNGGNSGNAKLCQKGGWESLYREDGSTFANQDECVSYGAQGGVILDEPPGSPYQQWCKSAGGTYTGVGPVPRYPEATGLGCVGLAIPYTDASGNLTAEYRAAYAAATAACLLSAPDGWDTSILNSIIVSNEGNLAETYCWLGKSA